MKKVFYLMLLMLATVFYADAQQNPMYSQYMFNQLVINPAYAGTKPYMSLSTLFRKQWMGTDGSPVGGSLSWHGPVKSRKMGLGLLINNDHIGIVTQTDIYGNYDYQIPFKKGKLSLGISGGLSVIKSDFSKLEYVDINDPAYVSNYESSVLPNFGAGAFYYTDKFYLGLSSPQLLSYKSDDNLSAKKDYVHHPKAHFYFTSGYVFETNSSVKLKPSILVKYISNAPVQVDVNLNALFNDIIWIGVSYRYNDAVVGIFEYQMSRKLRLGFAYDYTYTNLNKMVGATYEVMFEYNFGYDIMKIKNPRYF